MCDPIASDLLLDSFRLKLPFREHTLYILLSNVSFFPYKNDSLINSNLNGHISSTKFNGQNNKKKENKTMKNLRKNQPFLFLHPIGSG